MFTRNYRDSLGEFSNTSNGMFVAERVNMLMNIVTWGILKMLDSSIPSSPGFLCVSGHGKEGGGVGGSAYTQ